MDSNIDYRLIFAIMSGKVSRILQRRLDEEFSKADSEITCVQYDVLLALSMDDRCTQQRLCDLTLISKTKMKRLLDDLEQKGILRRERSEGDSRSNCIVMTPYGEEVCDRARMLAGHVLKESLRGLSRRDILVAQRSFNTVLQNLDETKRRERQNEADEALRQRRNKLLRRLILHKV